MKSRSGGNEATDTQLPYDPRVTGHRSQLEPVLNVAYETFDSPEGRTQGKIRVGGGGLTGGGDAELLSKTLGQWRCSHSAPSGVWKDGDLWGGWGGGGWTGTRPRLAGKGPTVTGSPCRNSNRLTVRTVCAPPTRRPLRERSS